MCYIEELCGSTTYHANIWCNNNIIMWWHNKYVIMLLCVDWVACRRFIECNYSGIFLCMWPANERWHYIVTSSPIGWAHALHDNWLLCEEELIDNWETNGVMVCRKESDRGKWWISNMKKSSSEKIITGICNKTGSQACTPQGSFCACAQPMRDDVPM